MKKPITPALTPPDELSPAASKDSALQHEAVPQTGPMSKEARLALMRERHRGTAKVDVVEIELSCTDLNDELEARLKPRHSHGVTTTPIDPFELQERLNALSPEVLSTDDEVEEDATRRVNTQALLEQLSRLNLDAPLTMPIELDDIIELQELAQVHHVQIGRPRPKRLSTEDTAAQSIPMPPIPIEELLPKTTKLERFNLAQATSGQSMTTTKEHHVHDVPQRVGPDVLPGVPKNFGVETLEGPRTPEQVETARFHLSQLPGVGITPQAPPTHHKPSQAQNPQVQRQHTLIAATLGVVFVLVGVVLGWMVLQ